MDLVKSDDVRFDRTSLQLTKRMELDEAQKFITGLDALESGFSWWIADFLNSMEALHGESYAQLVPEDKASTWAVYKWVGSRVKPATRRSSLSFSHHQVVASLLTERQEAYLRKAEEDKLPVSNLKRLIAEEKGKEPKQPKTIPITCPSCGAEFEVPK